MDRMDWAIHRFRTGNRKTFTIPFTHFMRKVGKIDPFAAAAVLRHQRQKCK